MCRLEEFIEATCRTCVDFPIRIYLNGDWKEFKVERPFWTRSPETITHNEYASCYKSSFGGTDDHFAVKHFRFEGQLEFAALLFVPCLQVRVIMLSQRDNALFGTNLSGEECFCIPDGELSNTAGRLQEQIAAKLEVQPHALQLLSDQGCQVHQHDEVIRDFNTTVVRVLVGQSHDQSNVGSIKLYLCHEFIRSGGQLLPDWLCFIRGVVDSSDLPRIMICQEKRNLVNKCLKMFEEIAESSDVKYQELYDRFGRHFKLGCNEDCMNRMRIAKLLRYRTLFSTTQMMSLTEYVSQMKDDQNRIYYITGERFSMPSSCRVLEDLRNKGLDVLYMLDPIDSDVVAALTEFDGKAFELISPEEHDEGCRKLMAAS
jgi:HSP90 family molecular chaperone